jgi:cadmium resistance protein CadD (predicted permease)
MLEIAITAGLAVALFVTTNIDDLFIVLAFLVDPRLRFRQVAAGQFLSMAALFACSVAASLLSLVIPTAWIGLLGLAPILIGARELWEQYGSRPHEDEAQPATATAGGACAVAAVTIANGGDNLGVYIPVFANQPFTALAVFGIVFVLMTWLWLVGARWLVGHPSLGTPIRRHGRRIAPFVLIGIGVSILHEAGSWGLLTNA